jgi:hypothetical protein
MFDPAFETYLGKVEADYRRGIATDHTYRSALETLIETVLPGTDASNDPKHIECGAPEEVWEFKVGGYQVCEKWLKDRKGRILSGEDISHYQQVVMALQETIGLVGEIDEAIESAGGWPIK